MNKVSLSSNQRILSLKFDIFYVIKQKSVLLAVEIYEIITHFHRG